VRGEADRGIEPKQSAPRLAMPIEGIQPSALVDSFYDKRDGRGHEAIDIPSQRGTPVHAVAEGNIAKLFTSKQGGLTVYQFDNSRTWCYYYAHLDRYAPGLKDGMLIRKGEVIGYVGTTGNAPKDTPHLHFAVFELNADKKWWAGKPLDPLPFFR
jgi:murein DD-endopeptidase MepM/ murein hydrolase activator NlpD